jgi:N utilization substance protein A
LTDEMRMESTTTYARPELLQVADTVARDKGIDKDEVLEAMEQAIQKAGRSKYGQEYDIRAEIDRRNGEIRLLRFREVVEAVENEATQMPLAAAQRLNAEAEIGDFITDPLPPIDFGRIAAQTAKQVIVQKVRDAERQRQYGEFKDRVGEIVNGLVKRVEFGNIVVDLGRAEAMLRRDELLPRESFRQGERVRAYIYDVRPETRGPQIFLSRTHPQFMAKLFAQEVPEIYDGIIEIRAVARDPGSRAKIAVISRDNGIDPVGACVGMRGSRVQAVVGELQGEKIDIIPWSSDPATFVVNGLAPAEVSKVVMDEEQKRIEVVVPDDQLSLAIGRRGQNVRLASQLTGWDIDILTEAEESERRTEEFRTRSQLFIDALDIDDVIAHLLVTEGFGSLEEVAYVPVEDLAEIEGFDVEVATELQERARNALERRDREYEERYRQLGVEDDLAVLEGLSPGMLVSLAENGIKTLDDFAGLAGDELVEMLDAAVRGGAKLELDEANTLIMAARAQAHWFDDDAEPAGAAPATVPGVEE